MRTAIALLLTLASAAALADTLQCGDSKPGHYDLFPPDEMKAILDLIRIWAQNKTENRAAWLQALNRVVCAGERSTGSILFLAFPQELIVKLA